MAFGIQRRHRITQPRMAWQRAVQIFKKEMRKMAQEKLSLEEKLAKVLFSYRATPQSTTGMSPAELLYGRRLRGKLDLLKPDVAARVRQQQARQKDTMIYTRRREGLSRVNKFGCGNTLDRGNPEWWLLYPVPSRLWYR